MIKLFSILNEIKVQGNKITPNSVYNLWAKLYQKCNSSTQAWDIGHKIFTDFETVDIDINPDLNPLLTYLENRSISELKRIHKNLEIEYNKK